jgi:excisionase family DNA binding protein
VLSVEELADKLGVSISLVHELVTRKRIPCYRIGTGRGTIRFEEADVEDYLQSCRQPAASAVTAPAVLPPVRKRRRSRPKWLF